jgi:hypothetical protein
MLTCAEKCTAWGTVLCVWRGVVLVWSVRWRLFLSEWGIWWRRAAVTAKQGPSRGVPGVSVCSGWHAEVGRVGKQFCAGKAVARGLSGGACSQFCERFC